MKFLHLGDLHIGKQLMGYSLASDQQFLFEKIDKLIQMDDISVVVIAGDLYDHSVPSSEAVNLCSQFLTHLVVDLKVKVLVVAGNHDSADRLRFASALLANQGLYIVSDLEEKLPVITLEDDKGPIHFYMMPYFFKPELRRLLQVDDYQLSMSELVQLYLSRQTLLEGRKVLVGHMTVVKGLATDEEIGTSSNIDPSVFEAFDYVALGHLHGYHKAGKNVFYSGSPLCYSLDEIHQEKNLVVVEIEEQLNMVLYEIEPLRQVREISGTLEELLALPSSDDYIFMHLTDDKMRINAGEQLRQHYPHYLGLKYDAISYNETLNVASLGKMKQMSPQNVYMSFYEEMTGKSVGQVEMDLFKRLFKEEA